MAKFSRQLKSLHARVIVGINAKCVAIYCVDACFTRVESCHDINQGEAPCKR
ncbi:flagellar biosynthesis protein FlgA [Salmonella enterica]|uniref:Flagellar biosynthesis protein FlgA n=1 Tax=Salmonella enterica TaxID=28901 RepID=A0A3L2MQ95_SALER|nr:flagellar biosynthesis protein FlgA [Salmonella enterica subsp. houtenae]EAB2654671.1 flagellar biosynthesis protein FlgA [Salmonella enterica]EAU5130197.1 flagellar biosynthesis protein FlgA [Salmonella enterica subsp. enterica serovar Oranienburg]EAW2132595.1 flagellar biosynthesis protein FlgA [Salmonella enterica subsp. enterica]EBI0038750.1 flagellar biosynthesis protein FlgA [Salmonella enterica subsp. diarizonae serovar 61:k:z35]ECT3982901.1 flagellar biosynthesis protein FlgA [Salmo